MQGTSIGIPLCRLVPDNEEQHEYVKGLVKSEMDSDSGLGR
jgi:hypothetical protein